MNQLQYPADLSRAYQIYKKHTALVTKWLLQNGQSLQQPPAPRPKGKGKKARAKAKKAAAAPLENTPRQVSTQELLKLADTARENQQGIPEYIYQALQIAIDLRRSVTAFFVRNSSQATEQNEAHAYFTESLQQIFDKLGGRQWDEKSQNGLLRPKITELSRPKYQEGVKPPSLFSNRFSALEKALEDLDIVGNSEGEAVLISGTTSTQTSSSKEKSSEQQLFEEYGISEDELFQFCRDWMYIRFLDFIFEEVVSYWAAQTTVSLSKVISLSWLTNAAFEIAAIRVDIAVRDEPLLANHVHLMREIMRLRNLGSDSPPGVCIENWNGEFSEGPGLVFPWLDLIALLEVPEEMSDDDDNEIKRPTTIMANAMKECFRVLLEKRERERIPFITKMYPVVNEFKAFMDRNPELNSITNTIGIKIDTTLVFGLHLLGALPVPSKKDYNSMSVEFAILIRSNLLASQDDEGAKCLCESCGGIALFILIQDFKSNLDRYLSDHETTTTGPDGKPKSNLYIDSFWTVGANSVELLSWATDVGLRLCSRNSYLSTVLHLYNMLRQLGVLTENEKIPIFDALCSFLCEKIFLGRELPQRNFHTCFLRSTGARLRPGDHKVLKNIYQQCADSLSARERQANRSGHVLQGPACRSNKYKYSLKPTSADEEYSARLIPSSLSLFYCMDNQGYKMSEEQWVYVYRMAESGGKGNEKLWRHPAPSDTLKKNKELCQQATDDPLHIRLRQLKAAVAHEFQKPPPSSNPSTNSRPPEAFPCALVNYFKIFRVSTNILRTTMVLSTESTAGATSDGGGQHQLRSAKSGRLWAENMFEFVDLLIKGGNIRAASRKESGDLCTEFPQLKCARDAMLEIRETSLDDYLWDI